MSLQNRPKSRLTDRRRALHDITKGINEADIFILNIDEEIRREGLVKFERELKLKNYDDAVEDIEKNFQKNVDKQKLYGLIMENVDKELEEMMQSANNQKVKRF